MGELTEQFNEMTAKLGRTRELEDTPSVRGMIAKVAHLLRVVESR